MPFRSKRQQRWMFAAEARGELPKGTAKRWAKHTPDIAQLPDRASSSSSESSSGSDQLSSEERSKAATRLTHLAFELALRDGPSESCLALLKLAESVRVGRSWAGTKQASSGFQQPSSNKSNPTGLNTLAQKQPSAYEKTIASMTNPVDILQKFRKKFRTSLPRMIPGMNQGGVQKSGASGKQIGNSNTDKRQATPQSTSELIDELLPTDTFGSFFLDYFTPWTWGSTRAGRATQLAEATRQSVPFSVRHPVLSRFLSGLGGAALGTLPLVFDTPLPWPSNWPDLRMLGPVAGFFAGDLASALYGRMAMHNIASKAKQDAALSPSLPVSILHDPLSFLRGSHQTGQVEMYRALKNRLEKPDPNFSERDLVYLWRELNGLFLPKISVLPLAHSVLQSQRARKAVLSELSDSQPSSAPQTGTRLSKKVFA